MPGMPTAKPQPTRTAAAAHLFAAGLADWIEVFRAGTHTDSKGTSCTFTTEDLDQMVANVSLGKPPAVLGHPKHDDPAFGWAELKRDGESLFAKFDDVNPAFEEGVKTGAYRNRSVSVLKDAAAGWRVRHIGWLGAAPPAIDGLKPVSFSADDEPELHEFGSGDDFTTAWALGDVASLLRGMREWVIAKEGVEAADRVLPAYQITSISDAAARLREQAQTEATALYTAPTPNDPTGTAMSLTQADLDRAVTEAEARVRTELQAQFTAQNQQLTQLQTERRDERIQKLIDGWKASGKLLPADEAGLKEFMVAMEAAAAAEFEFTAAAGKTPAKQTPAQWFATFMAARKPLVRIGGSQGGSDTDPPGDSGLSDREIADRAHAYQAAQDKSGHRITMAAAIDAVKQGKDKA